MPVPNTHKYGCDVHEYLIAMWQAVSKGWMPPEVVTEEQYHYIKNNLDENPALSGYVGFALSYGAKWWGGYRRDVKGTADCSKLKAENECNQSRRSYNSMAKQAPLLRGVTFVQRSVFDIGNIPYKSIIYCDPPYKNATKYRDDFDHDKFYQWCRDKHEEGHYVYVSEYDMPDDFTCIWEKEVNSSLTKDTGGKKATERLFTLV